MRLSLNPASSIVNQQDVHVTYQIVGFDRLSFVSDITGRIPQDGSCSILAIAFEADGRQANGRLTVRMREDQRLKINLIQQLRSIRGIVSVREL